MRHFDIAHFAEIRQSLPTSEVCTSVPFTDACLVTARGALTKQPLGWNNVEGFLKACYGSWGQKGCFSVNSMREFADIPPKTRQIMIANMTKAHQFLIDNLAAARGGTDDNESLADLIIMFFCGICLEQNLDPDRARITKKIDAFMRLIRAI